MGTTLQSRAAALTVVAVMAAVAITMAAGSAKTAQAQAFIEPPLPPTNLTAVNGDNPGEAHLSWKPSANADVHWIAGIAVSDWSAGDYSNLIWEPADGNTSHSLAGLKPGFEYVFTVSAGQYMTAKAITWAAYFRRCRAAATGIWTIRET